MTIIIKYLTLVVLATLLSGCAFGTYATRMENGHGSVAGRYPFEAVYQDVRIISEGPKEQFDFRPFCYVSLPFDLAIDLILSPVDLILWPIGFKKSPTKDEINRTK